MKRTYFLTLLTLLAVLCGYLLSKASLVGKVGMTYVYQEYAFLKTWWQGALFVLVVWLLFFLAQQAVQRSSKAATAKLVHISCIVIAAIGLFLTYQDFRNTLSHRLLGERFHLGGYLFWLGWMLISIYLLAGSNSRPNPKAAAALKNTV